jgi:surfeit locus 1 family protein
MSDARAPAGRRFPIGLTLATAVSLAILIALGAWQLQRMAWKADLLAHIEALKTAPATPIAPVLARVRAGETVDWTRVAVDCVPAPNRARTDSLRNAVRDGEIVWRVLSRCRLPSGPYREILIDRGLVASATGAVQPPALDLPPVAGATGVLVPLADLSREALAERPADAPALALMVETETPAPSGIVPAPLPPEVPNRHLEYALTWFGLAGALAAVYAAVLRRRMKSA